MITINQKQNLPTKTEINHLFKVGLTSYFIALFFHVNYHTLFIPCTVALLRDVSAGYLLIVPDRQLCAPL